jgi:outer membrane protein assembly factor BamA
MGLLTVRFPLIATAEAGAGKVAVTVTVDEGPIWLLGKVDVAGDDLPLDEMRKAAKFPEGKTANWKQIKDEISAMEAVLQRDGYLRVSANSERLYRKEGGVVDLAIRVKKGPQIRFGALRLNGLSPAAEREATAMWKIGEGEPMNGPYIDEYVKAVLKGPARGVHGVGRELNIRPGSNVMDVAITFK